MLLRKISNRTHAFLVKTFIYSTPFIIVLSMMGIPDEVSFKSLVMAFVFLSWTLLGIYFFISIFVSSTNRESVWKTVFSICERDEREGLVTAQAARSSFLLMLGMIFLLFFVSTFRLSYRAKDPSGVKGIAGIYVANVSFKPVPREKIANWGDFKDVTPPVKYQEYDFPASITGTLFFLFIFQIITFKLFALKYSKGGNNGK